jgi:fermentation-respiration switch protein FrsA (DUF1100 family)
MMTLESRTSAPSVDRSPRTSLLRRPIALLVLLLATVAAWQLLAMKGIGAAERFYFLLPPLCAAVLILRTPGGWRELRPVGRRVLVFVGCLTVLLTGLQLAARQIILRNAGFYVAMPQLSEQLTCLYLAAAFCLTVFLILGLLRAGGRWVDRCWHGPCPEPPPRRRLVLRNDVPVLLLLPICFPYLMAALYIHRPKGVNLDNPTAVTGRAFDDVAFTASDGVTLRGWFLPVKTGTSSRTAVMCHGLGGVRSDILHNFALADALQANILVFDFRGHGDSDGHTVTFGCREKLDVIAAIAYLRAQYPEQARQIVGYGMSMGAAALVLGAAEVEPPLDAVILDSSFASAVELTDTVLGSIPTPLRQSILVPGLPLASLHAGCDLHSSRPVDAIGRVRAPLLLIHARGDTLIPVEHSRRLFAQAQEPKSLWLTDTGDHCSSSATGVEYLRRCQQLLAH